MINKAISDLAKVLVINFYSNIDDPNNLGGSYITEILIPLREADIEFGGRGYTVDLILDSHGLIISAKINGEEKSESFTWNQIPKAVNRAEVLIFIERILKNYFYK
ncbi:hypothetical protein MMP66_16960 [Acinetobacter dispersus]|uniref:hypothetical protein n=1 Tax=Acinetobacter dispersus TaxID=70348 RepID=UPI001F4B70E0|nr:hypothetical protein [Acinetobacter dispersus]MCH7395944.1 hypothetical protein [Acinetobacter dispersus]